MSGKGDVYSYAVRMGQEPSIIALIHLAEGPYVTAPLQGVDASIVFIGMPVELADDCKPLTFRLRRSLTE